MNKFKQALIVLLACSSMCAFAQDSIGRLAVYAFGASDAGVNKSFAAKLLNSLAQSGAYSEIGEQETFYNEFANAPAGLDQILQAAKRHGADFACAVSLTEAFGAYSINARMVKTADSQVVKTVSIDRSIKSLDELTAVSGELARLLHPQAPPPVPIVTPALVVPEPAAVAPPQKECAQLLNVNELLFKVSNVFPAKLKDCSSKLVKEMALAAAPSFGKKQSAPIEPKSFIMGCSVESLRKEFSEIPSADKLIGSVEVFVTGIMGSVSSGGSLDPKKLVSAVGSMNVNDLLSDIKKGFAGDGCIVDAPYEPPAAASMESGGGESAEEKEDEGIFSLGIRTGFNFSHLYAYYSYPYYGSGEGSYDDILGFQAGLVFDIAVSSWFHLQPGLMYIQKGSENITTHYLDIPLLLSLKLSAFRINAGPYFGICLASSGYRSRYFEEPDFGMSLGAGFDIGMFYIGAFYNYGLFDIDAKPSFESYNRTLGFNLGVNL